MAGIFSSNAPAQQEMSAKKDEMKRAIQQELAVAGAQQLINKITENCFAKCVTRPGPSLSSSEDRCLAQCMVLYMAAFDQTSKSYVARIAKERTAGNAAAANAL